MDEAVLRGEAARIWISVQRSNDNAILDQIFEERHPRIASDVLKGLARNWDGLTKARKHELIARLKVFVASPTVAVPLVESLVQIDRVEVYGPNPPWPLFAELLPVLLDHRPCRRSRPGPCESSRHSRASGPHNACGRTARFWRRRASPPALTR